MFKRIGLICLAFLALCAAGVGIAWAATTGSTGTNVACATATATTPAHTIGVDGAAVHTIAGAQKVTKHCVTQTYTVPTTTVTSTVTQPVTSSTTSSTTTSSTTVTPPPPSGALVGVGADPKVTCNTTVSSAGAVSATLASAAAGSVVCLKPATTFGAISISNGMSQGVTLDGQGDSVAGISLDAVVSNLTIQGVNFTDGFYDADPSTHVTLRYSTISHVAKGDAIVLNNNAHGNGSAPISGFTASYDQIDHVGECLGEVGGQTGTTFTHDVCGPGLGYGDTASTDPGHYIQTGGGSTTSPEAITVTHDAFVGPADPAAARVGLHLNVFHDWGNTSGMVFDNNLLWHDDAIGQAMLLQTGHFDNVEIKNNVAVENPNDGVSAYVFWVDNAHGLTYANNTTVTSVYGNLVTIGQVFSGTTACSQPPNNGDRCDYTSSTNASASGNLTTGTTGNPDCQFSVPQSNNYSGDASCSLRFNGAWQNTSWTPSLPYSPPPAGWYQPVGLSGVGYQGSVGP